MSNGKGMRPALGYNRALWESNYDNIFRKKKKHKIDKKYKNKQNGATK
jgi:hypothetical protein